MVLLNSVIFFSLLVTLLLFVNATIPERKKGVAIGGSIFLIMLFIVVCGINYLTPGSNYAIINNIFFIFIMNLIYSVVMAIVLGNTEAFQEEITIKNVLPFSILAIATLIMIINIFINFNRDSYYKYATSQIKEEKVELLEYDKDVEKIAMSKTYARYLIGKAMNKVPNSELYQINNLSIQKVNGKISYVADLEFTGYFKWRKEKEFPGYFIVDASNNNSKAEFVKEPYKYAESAYFDHNIKRKMRKEIPDKYFIGDPTIEIDDKGKVYYTMTLADPINVTSGRKIYGVYLMDAKTGEGKLYKKNEIPKWVDGGIDPLYAYEIADYYATWKEGRFNFSGKGQMALNDNGSFRGMKPILIKNQLHYLIEYSTLKNEGNNSMVGYIIMNSNNGKFYVSKNNKESLIDSSGAASQGTKKYIEKKFSAKSPMLYSFDGKLAWTLSMHDGDGLFQNFFIVSATNPNVSASGSTIESASEEFKKALSKSATLQVDESKLEEVEKEIIVEDIKYIQNGEFHYLYIKDSEGQMFVYNSEKPIEQMFAKKNDKLKIKFKLIGDEEFNNIISFE